MANRVAFVTVTIPVDLEADTPLERVDWWNKAALQNCSFYVRSDAK